MSGGRTEMRCHYCQQPVSFTTGSPRHVDNSPLCMEGSVRWIDGNMMWEQFACDHFNSGYKSGISDARSTASSQMVGLYATSDEKLGVLNAIAALVKETEGRR